MVHSAYRDRRAGLLRGRRAEFFQLQRLSTLPHNKRLPNKRSFGHVNDEEVDVIHQRIKQWRASIYEKRLWEVPPSTKQACLLMSMLSVWHVLFTIHFLCWLVTDMQR